MRGRPVGDDVDALVDLFGRVEMAEIGRRETTRADVRHLLAAPGLNSASRTWVLESEDGRLCGFAALHPAPQAGQLRAHIAVVPGAAADTARTLLRLLDAWAADDAAGHGVPVTLFQLPQSLLRDQLAAAGWTVVHSYTRLTIDLDAAATGESTHSNDGVRVRAATDDLDRRTIHSVVEDAVAGHWNHERRDFAGFDCDQRGRDGYDPALWWLAEVDGTPAGAVIARGPADRAWIAWLGVLEAYRGRGIGKLLLHTAFSRLRERGHHTVGVDVDTHNSTGAVKVYRAAGMAVLGTADQWRKMSAAARAGTRLSLVFDAESEDEYGHVTGDTVLLVHLPDLDAVAEPWLQASTSDGISAHVTVLVPFLPEDRIDEAVLEELRHIFAGQLAFELTFQRTGRFPETLYLAPEPEQPLLALTNAVYELWPECPPYEGRFPDPVPHLTVVHAKGDDVYEEARRVLETRLPVRTKATSVDLLCFDGRRWNLRERFPLAAEGAADSAAH